MADGTKMSEQATILTLDIVDLVLDLGQGGRIGFIGRRASRSTLAGPTTKSRSVALPAGPFSGSDPSRVAAAILVRQTGLRDIALVDLGTFAGPATKAAETRLNLAYLGVALPPVSGSLDPLKASAARFGLAEAARLSVRDARVLSLGLRELANRRPAALTDGRTPARVPQLILAAGLTASGKSTFARALCARAPGLIHLDVDAIRRSLTADSPTYKHQEAWATHNSTRALAEWALRAERSVIIDATGLTAADRAHYLASAPLFGARSILVWLETDEPEAANRLAKRASGTDPADHSSADAEFRHRSLARLERPRLAEADSLLPATPGNLDTVMGILLGALGGQS